MHKQRFSELVPDPAVDPDAPEDGKSSDKNTTVKPQFAPGTESIMRVQLINVFNAQQKELLTTTEQKRIEKIYRNEVEAVAKAQRKAIKAKTEEDVKTEKLKQYKQFLTNKLVKKIGELNAQQKAEAEQDLLLLEQGGEGYVPPADEEQDDYESSGQGSGGGGMYPKKLLKPQSAISEESIAGEVEGGSRRKVRKSTKTRQKSKAQQQRPSDWFNHEYKEGDEYDFDVDVGTDSVESIVYSDIKVKPKMYNVAIQVNPKSKSQITKTAPWTKIKPKMYDVSVGVGPSDFAHVVKRPMNYEELQQWPGEGEAEGEGEEYDEYAHLTPEERERRLAEKFRLERKASKRADAYTLARPTYYRELPLSTSMDDLTFDKETEVTEYDIEKMEAEARGLGLEKNNILWPTIKDFSAEIGEMKLNDYIRRAWKLDSEWLYHIRLIQTHTTDFRKKYIFEVIFSIPTNEAPVPPATASVFFVYEIGKFSHIEESIKVSYVLEGTRYPHTPGHIPFQQKWLQGIISDKLRIQRTIDF